MIQKTLNSFRYAFRGIRFALLSENNIRIHSIATVVVLGLSIWLKLSHNDWCWIIACIGWVWMAELFNTALEKLVDLVSPEVHPLAGKVKDIAAGAVLISSTAAFLIGIIIFLKYLPI
jgi:diacylglycerol kinase (ATP)